MTPDVPPSPSGAPLDPATDTPVSLPVPEIALLVFSRLLRGDPRLLERLGLQQTDLDRLRTLPADNLHRLLEHAARSAVVEVRFHRRALKRLLRHLTAEGRHEDEIRQMITADASLPFMAHFYGLSYPLYHQYRQQAGLLRAPGRPAPPSPAAAGQIRTLLQKLDLLDRDRSAGPADLLAIHQLTGHTLRDIWRIYSDATRPDTGTGGFA